MDGFKDIADSFEQLLYEILGLLLPGSALVFALVAVLGEPWWTALLQFIGDHPWLSFGGAYVLGYPVQGISRPVTTLFAWLCSLPLRLILARAHRNNAPLITKSGEDPPSYDVVGKLSIS